MLMLHTIHEDLGVDFLKMRFSLRRTFLFLKSYTNFLYFLFTTSCLEYKVAFNLLHRYHCDVKNNKFIIVSTTSRKMYVIISTTNQSRPTPLLHIIFSTPPPTRLLVLALHYNQPPYLYSMTDKS